MIQALYQALQIVSFLSRKHDSQLASVQFEHNNSWQTLYHSSNRVMHTFIALQVNPAQAKVPHVMQVVIEPTAIEYAGRAHWNPGKRATCLMHKRTRLTTAPVSSSRITGIRQGPTTEESMTMATPKGSLIPDISYFRRKNVIDGMKSNNNANHCKVEQKDREKQCSCPSAPYLG